MIPKWYRGLLLALLLVVCSSAASAQAVSGTINGTVVDTTGAIIPGASVTIADQDRGTIYNATSDAQGNFSQMHLLGGQYQLKCESTGFSPFIANATVQVDAVTRVYATMTPAGERTEITVATETPLLIADRAEIATSFASHEIQSLPILDRNVTNLVPAVPGVQLNSWQHGISENPQQVINVNVNGQFFSSNGFLLDGTENQSAILGIAVINPNLDSLQDFKVSTGNYDVEFGSAAGALLQATTKSGTNRIHGSLFEFLRNSAANAADPFTLQNPPLRWNQFGGSFGGPIRKDRVFLFADYQGMRRRTGGSLLTTVPTQAERNGDLSGLLGDYICADGSVSTMNCARPTIVPTTEGGTVQARAGMVFDPNSGDTTGARRRVFTQKGQINVVPVAGPIAKLLATLPLPNSGSKIFNNFVSITNQRFDSDQYDGRIDYNITDATHVFGRYSIADFNILSPAAFGDVAGGPSAFGFSGQSLDRNQSLSVGLDHGFGPALITDARFGFYRYRVRVQPLGLDTTPATDAGLPRLNTGSAETSGMPAFYVNGSGGFSFGYAIGVNGCRCPTFETENHFQWVNNWTKELNRHVLKFGLDFRTAQQQRIPGDSHPAGEIQFIDASTGNSELDALAAGQASTGSGLASFFLGQPYYFGRFDVNSTYHPGLRQTRLFLYTGDSWRVTPKLTVNYGLRWEDYLPQTAAEPGGAGSFDPATGEVLAAGIGSVPLNLGVRPYNLGFAPRLGVAYRVLAGTVIRAGFGRSFTPGALGAVFGQSVDHNPPIVNAQSVASSNFYVPAFNLLNGPPAAAHVPVAASGRYPLPDGIAVYGFVNPPDSYRIPEVEFWNFAVQHEFRPDLALDVAYVGNVGRHQFVALNRNQAIPGPGDLDARRPFFKLYGLTQPLDQNCNCDNSSYNALQTKLQKSFGHGLNFLLTYTWGKAMNNGEGGMGVSNNYDLRESHGPASWDRTHTVTVTYSWDLPLGKGRHWALGQSAIAEAILGGWRLSGVHEFASGLPFTPIVANAPLLNADFNYVRADLIGDPHVPDPNRNLWFNTEAYSEPQQPYRNGTASRDSLRGPRLAVSDVSIAKNVLPSEGKSLELRADAFNVFNHVNLGLPSSYIDYFGAGQITTTQVPMRQLQFGLHFQF